MQQQSKVIIADTSYFILLDKITSLDILFELFGEITMTPEVQHEFGKPLPIWIKIEPAKDVNQQLLLEAEMDKGEASAIALAIETTNSLLILDDLKARKLAVRLNLPFTGTLGVLLKAKEAGVISALTPVLEKIQQTDFRFSESTLKEILKSSNEL